MKRGGFVSPEAVAKLEQISKETRDNATPAQKKVLAEADAAFAEINDLVSDFSSENRVRAAGYLPSEAEELSTLMRDRKIQIGQLFEFKGKTKVKTPFNTVVDAQVYVTHLQQSLITFTSMSFLDLIKYAFKQLFTTLKGKLNG